MYFTLILEVKRKKQDLKLEAAEKNLGDKKEQVEQGLVRFGVQFGEVVVSHLLQNRLNDH